MNGIMLNLLIVTLLSTFSYAQTNYAKFPGRKSSLPSPNHRYVLRNVDQSGGSYHAISLTDRKTGKTRQVYDYGRHASVIWAPDSRHFAINNYAGSDFTKTYITGVDGSAPPIDVQQELRSKAIAIEKLAQGDHEYFGVSRWLDDHRVIVHRFGHDSDTRAAFCQCYIYTLNGSVVKCASQPASADLEEQCWKTTP